MRLFCIMLLVTSSVFLRAQECRIEFERLFNNRLGVLNEKGVVVHLKYKSSSIFSKTLMEENITGDLFLSSGVTLYQDNKYEMFQNRKSQLLLNKKNKLMILSNISDKEGYLNNFKIGQRKAFVDSCEIRMADTLLDNMRLKWFSLLPKKSIEKVSNIKRVDYFFSKINDSVYKMAFYYNNKNTVSTCSMIFEEVNRSKNENFEKEVLSRYFTKLGLVKKEFKDFQIIDNRR